MTSLTRAVVAAPAAFAAGLSALRYVQIRHGAPVSEALDWALLIATIGFGTVFVWRSIPELRWRLLGVAGYVAAMCVLCFFIALSISCAWGDCL